MSNVYDYAYAHVMRPPATVNESSEELTSESCSHQEIIINVHDFAPRDLQLFVDSLETITRLARAKHQRRQQLKIKQHRDACENSRKAISYLDSSMVGISGSKNNSNVKCTVPYERSRRSKSCNDLNNTYYSISESEESGVFFSNTQASNFYENIHIDPIRERSVVITHPKSKTLKSRLVSLIMKKKYLQPEAPPITKVLSSTLLGENLEDSDIYERVLDDVIEHQFSKNCKKAQKHQHFLKRKRCFSCPEHKVLEKALRFLNP